jgi:hypothetical protein
VNNPLNDIKHIRNAVVVLAVVVPLVLYFVAHIGLAFMDPFDGMATALFAFIGLTMLALVLAVVHYTLQEDIW